jgi:hypothetical protein
LKKPAKTREVPTDLVISFVPQEDSWKVEIMRDEPQDADRWETIETIADRHAQPVRSEGLIAEPGPSIGGRLW